MKKITINRKDLKNNLKVIKKRLYAEGKDDFGNRPKIIAVVKGNGMGLGLIQYSKFLVNNGIDFLAVANVDEALLLRKAGIKEKILMLTPVINAKEIIRLIKNEITLTISSINQIELIERIIKKKNTQVDVHIKIDTGFGRYGFLSDDLDGILNAFKLCENIKITRYVYTLL